MKRCQVYNCDSRRDLRLIPTKVKGMTVQMWLCEQHFNTIREAFIRPNQRESLNATVDNQNA